MIGKFVCLLALLVSIAAIENRLPDKDRPTHNLEVGSRTCHDRLIVKEDFIDTNIGTGEVKKTWYSLNEQGRITLVQALDQHTDGKGGYAAVMDGGPGANNVTLLFKGQGGTGIYFLIKVYAE